MRGHTGASMGNIDVPKVRRKKKVDAGTPKPVQTKISTSKVHQDTLKHPLYQIRRSLLEKSKREKAKEANILLEDRYVQMVT